MDDQPDLISPLENLLTGSGHKVILLSSAEEALAILSREEFDLIISDYEMPEMTGDQFLKAAHDITNKQCPMILVSGAPNDDAKTFARNTGIRLLQKPFSLKDILE